MRGRTSTEGVTEGGEYAIVPEGDYPVEIIEVADGYTKTNNDPMINVKFMITSGPQKGSWVFDNIIIPNEGSPAMKIMGRTMHFLHVIGEPYEGNFDYDTDNWKYKGLRINVYHNDYKGKAHAKVGTHMPLDDVPEEEMPF